MECAFDNYTINAVADTVLGETNTTCSIFSAGQAEVAILGDISITVKSTY
jgi:hypothetical protein